MTQRLMPPVNGLNNPFNMEDRVYQCSPGSTIDVPDTGGFFLDAPTLISNGWVPCSTSGVGVTAARPSDLSATSTFIDTTLGALVVYDGATWRNPVTGAAV